MFLPVDNDGGDLLIHEEENGEKDCRDTCCQVNIPLEGIVGERHDPAGADVGPGWLKRLQIQYTHTLEQR